MIRLATVFSGIGAIEHALKRMGLEHKIVFACDNGDVEILTKNVGMNLDDIGEELNALKKIIKTIQINDEIDDLYKNQLSNMLDEATTEFKEIETRISELPMYDDTVKRVLEKILSMDSLKTARKKEYKQFYSEIGKGSFFQAVFRELEIILQISNDFKKDNSLKDLGKDMEFESSDGINWRLI